MTAYRYAYLGLHRSAAKLHILHVDHGILCRPAASDYWTPPHMAGMEVDSSDSLWIDFVVARTLCARCRRVFEAEQGVKT